MICKSCSVEAGVREIDSEFCLVLKMFSLRKLYEVSYGFGEDGLCDRSGSIVLAEDLEWPIAIGRQIVAAIRLSISSRYRKRCRKIIGEADGIECIVSPGARKLVCDVLYFSCEILIKKSFLELFGSYFGFGFFDSEFVYEVGIKLGKHPIYLFIARKLTNQYLDLTIKIPDVFHVASRDDIELGIEEIDLLLIAGAWIVCKNVQMLKRSNSQENHNRGQKDFFHAK